MDEENKQVTADEVYSYGESTEEPAGEPVLWRGDVIHVY